MFKLLSAQLAIRISGMKPLSSFICLLKISTF